MACVTLSLPFGGHPILQLVCKVIFSLPLWLIPTELDRDRGQIWLALYYLEVFILQLQLLSISLSSCPF